MRTLTEVTKYQLFQAKTLLSRRRGQPLPVVPKNCVGQTMLKIGHFHWVHFQPLHSSRCLCGVEKLEDVVRQRVIHYSLQNEQCDNSHELMCSDSERLYLLEILIKNVFSDYADCSLDEEKTCCIMCKYRLIESGLKTSSTKSDTPGQSITRCLGHTRFQQSFYHIRVCTEILATLFQSDMAKEVWAGHTVCIIPA